MKLNVAIFVGVLVVLGMTFFRNTFSSKVVASETCPDGGGWIKIDSGDLSLYPVVGATQYCFKAGNWPTVSAIPTGGFGQDGPCNQDIKYCDLSHWSYFDPGSGTPTPTPTATATSTGDSNPTPTATATATGTEIATATPTATATGDSCDGDCNEPTSTPVATETPMATETPNGDVCANLDGIQTSLPDGYHFDNDHINCLQFELGGPSQPSSTVSVLGTSTSQVLGASTMAGTGVVEDSLFYSIFTFGSLLTSLGIMKNGKKRN